MLPPAKAVRILQYCAEKTQSVSQIMIKLGGRHQTTISAIRELSARRLLQVTPEKSGVGRPKHLVQTTPLGKQFVEEYSQLLDIGLQSSNNDIKKALKQVEETRRLLELGVDPYVRFQEVNEIVRNIASTSQIGRHA